MNPSLEFDKLFVKGASVMVVDPDGRYDFQERKDDDKIILYFDLSNCREGDFALIANEIYRYIAADECMISGLLLDNIDCIPKNSDSNNLENLVAFALKNDGDYIAPGHSAPIPFDRMSVAARCRQRPAFLDDYHIISFVLPIPAHKS